MSRHVILGSGAVGRAVVAALGARGIDALVVTRSGTVVDGARAEACDVLDTERLAGLCAGADAVYQACQPEYHRWPEEFPAMQASVMEASARSGAVLVAVENLYGYGHVKGPLVETLPLDATTRKGRARAGLWRDLEAAHAAGRLKATAGRASDFFGPYAGASQVGERFFGPLLAGGKAEVFGRPEALHSYTYVVDFGEALVRLALDDRSLGKAWHVPNAPAVTNGEFLARAARAAGTEPRSVRRTAMQLRMAGFFIKPAREVIEMLYEFEEDFVVDHSAYAEVFGDHATPLDESVAASVEWWRRHAKDTGHR